MHTSNYLYHCKEQEYYGYLAYDDSITAQRPAVIIAHDWTGRNDFACEKAEMMAKLGYIGFALDMYGQARQGNLLHEKKALMEPLVNERFLLRERIRAAFDAVIALPEVDQNNVAAIGFCFGGMCVLDLARSGAEVKAVISVHGLLNKSETLKNETIKAKVLALHGYEDPMVSWQDLNGFGQEMTQAKVDWQAHVYGHAKHAFTNPHAHDANLGTVFNARAERRAMVTIERFLQKTFS